MNLKKAIVGIMSLDRYKERTIAIARGQYKPKKREPKIWFTSIKSLASVLSEENQKLLKLIIKEEPQSVSELEILTGRKANNILRTLRKMEQYGLVELRESKKHQRGRAPLIPRALYDEFDIELSLV